MILFAGKHGFGKGLMFAAGFGYAMAAMWLASVALTALATRNWQLSALDLAVASFACIYLLGTFLFDWPSASTLALIGVATGTVIWTATWLLRIRK